MSSEEVASAVEKPEDGQDVAQVQDAQNEEVEATEEPKAVAGEFVMLDID